MKEEAFILPIGTIIISVSVPVSVTSELLLSVILKYRLAVPLTVLI